MGAERALTRTKANTVLTDLKACFEGGALTVSLSSTSDMLALRACVTIIAGRPRWGQAHSRGGGSWARRGGGMNKWGVTYGLHRMSIVGRLPQTCG